MPSREPFMAELLMSAVVVDMTTGVVEPPHLHSLSDSYPMPGVRIP